MFLNVWGKGGSGSTREQIATPSKPGNLTLRDFSTEHKLELSGIISCTNGQGNLQFFLRLC